MPVETSQEEEAGKAYSRISQRAAVQPATVKHVERARKLAPVSEKSKSIWREIFEGHEEMLGWTPD